MLTKGLAGLQHQNCSDSEMMARSEQSREGGLGVPDFEWTYITTRLSHLLNMLNNDDSTVREMARASLFLDLGKCKVPLARESEPSFLGFCKKANSKLYMHAAGFGVRSDWPDQRSLQLDWPQWSLLS